MQRNLQRAQMLLSQGRSEMAESELRRALAEQPDNATVHALLAAALVDQQKYSQASEEAERAIHLAPDTSLPHYMMGQVMYHRNRFAEAGRAARTAVELDPYDADYFALIAAIELEQRHWKKALRAAEQGLDAEPEHVRCVNLRAVALTKLGRTAEAANSIDAALQKAPEDAWSHANQGWTLLHQSKPHEALVHFREALRLEPNMELARDGVVEAMKARNPIYRLLLHWFLLLARFSPRVQFLLLLGILFGQRLVIGLADRVPILKPVIPVVVFGYLGFVWMTWCGPTLFNMLLRFDRFGRLVLSPRERLQSTIAALYLLAALGVFVAGPLSGNPGLMILAIPFALMLIPLSAIFASTNRVLSGIMIAVTAAATWFAIVPMVPSLWIPDAFMTSVRICLYSTWASLFIVGTSQPKKI